ncbi:MAG: 4Fe-4S binding protein [Anaerolineales bacterium]
MNTDPYKLLAERLDTLPNGFPATEEGIELKLLAKIFTPEEAGLAAQLLLQKETPNQIAARIGGDPAALRTQLKGMSRRGLIEAGKVEGELGFGSMPFVVGIYEMQLANLDAEMAQLFEEYYQKVFGKTLAFSPSVHRVIPVGESVRMDIEVRPFESASQLISQAQAWGVQDCICRKQKALIGDPCDHRLDNCMVMSPRPGVFDNHPFVRPQTKEEAMATLRQAAEDGLVHSVSNNQQGNWYICNCCTCSCGILRGLTELGIADAVARSAFVNQVDETLCTGCELCLERCHFDALSMEDVVKVDEGRCIGCGVCVEACPDQALFLVRRPKEEVVAPPITMADWQAQRAAARGIDLV